MLVLGINKVLGWLQITTNGRTYTCITKQINGVDHFWFKKQWHKVGEYLGPLTTELVNVGGKIISRKVNS